LSYDAAGNRTTVADSKGGTTTGTFDALNRPTGREVGGAGATKHKVTWSYTADGQSDTTTRYTWTGSAFASVGTTTYAYDAADRVTGLRHADGAGNPLALYTFAYDAANRLTGESISGGRKGDSMIIGILPCPPESRTVPFPVPKCPVKGGVKHRPFVFFRPFGINTGFRPALPVSTGKTPVSGSRSVSFGHDPLVIRPRHYPSNST
jgi:hypothetical protein